MRGIKIKRKKFPKQWYYSYRPKSNNIDEQGHQSCDKLLLLRCLHVRFMVTCFKYAVTSHLISKLVCSWLTTLSQPSGKYIPSEFQNNSKHIKIDPTCLMELFCKAQRTSIFRSVFQTREKKIWILSFSSVCLIIVNVIICIQEDIKTLIVHIAETHGQFLDGVDYVSTFKGIKLQYDQIMDRRNSKPGAGERQVSMLTFEL